MAEPLERENEDPWEPPAPPEPWCETCEACHDHATWLAERAAMVTAWSESAQGLEWALGRSRAVLYSIGARSLGAVDGSEDAGTLFGEIDRLVADLRRITDAAAWRAQQEAAEAAAAAMAPEVAECGYCAIRITLLGGDWTADDGATACTDTSAAYVPHKPKEAGDE